MSVPDSNIVLAQIWPTSGPREIHAGQMWFVSLPTLLAVWDMYACIIIIIIIIIIIKTNFHIYITDFSTSIGWYSNIISVN